jgi:hypothetical protein
MGELSEETAFIEKELGPCVLLIKCYELLHRTGDAQAMAQQLSRMELDALGQMIDRKVTMGATSEQFLRTIYTFEVAKMQPQVDSIFKAFVQAAQRTVKTEGLWHNLRAFRIAVAQVLARDRNHELEAQLAPDSLGAFVVRAWSAGTRETLEQCIEALEDIVEVAENKDRLAPWDDVWQYILLARLRRAVPARNYEPGRDS